MAFKQWIYASVVMGLISTSVFANDTVAKTAVMTPPPANQQMNTAKMNYDRGMFMWVTNVDKGEIAMATMALKKDPSTDVRDYANMIITQHTQNLEDLKKLMKSLHTSPTSNKASNALKNGAMKEMSMLKKLKGTDFDKAYIGAMVNGHTDALKALDGYLSNIGPNTDVQQFVQATRDMVAGHLEQAKDIQGKMQG